MFRKTQSKTQNSRRSRKQRQETPTILFTPVNMNWYHKYTGIDSFHYASKREICMAKPSTPLHYLGGVKTVAILSLSPFSFILSYLRPNTEFLFEIAISPLGPSQPQSPPLVLVTVSGAYCLQRRGMAVDLDHRCSSNACHAT